MARKLDGLVKRGGVMLPFAPSISNKYYENNAWVTRSKKIAKGWIKRNGVMVPIFDDTPLGPPFTKRTFEANVEAVRASNNVLSGYHGSRRYAGSLPGDDPQGYLWTPSVTQVLSARISRPLNVTGGGQGSGFADTLDIYLDDRTAVPGDWAVVNWGISDVEVTFTHATTGNSVVVARDLTPASVVVAGATSASWPAECGLLRIAVPDDFMPSFFPTGSKLKIEFNKKVP